MRTLSSTLLSLAALTLVCATSGCSVETEKTPGAAGPAPESGAESAEPPAGEENQEPPVSGLKSIKPTLKLDTSFNAGNGIEDTTNDIYAALPGPGGVTYVALRKAGGSIGWGNGTIVRRYLSNGSLDTTFGDAGSLETTLVANPYGLAVDGQGRVLVGGSGFYSPSGDTGREIVVLRLTTAGEIDAGYGTAGRVTLTMPTINNEARRIWARADGGAFVSASGRTNGKESYGTFLVDGAGTPITAYGSKGYASSPFPADGATVLGSEVLVPTVDGVVGYDAAGSSNGVRVAGPIVAVKPTPDGGFAVIRMVSETAMELGRHTSTGKRDATFTAAPVSDAVVDFVVRADGSHVVAEASGISWVAREGGAPEALAPDVAANAIQLDGSKLLVRTGSSVLRYTLE